VLGCDLVVTASEEALSKMREGYSHVVVNSYEAPTSAFLGNPDLRFPAQGMKQSISQAVGAAGYAEVNATRLATALLGDALASNMFMLGFAWQKGLIPVSEEAILEAIRLNATAVEFNQQAFVWGRHAAYDPARIEALVNPGSVVRFVPRETLETVLQRFSTMLRQYQNDQLVSRYRALVARVQATESRLRLEKQTLSLAVAKTYAHILAYKDEYEVARLYTDDTFMQEIQAAFEGNYKLKFHLGPSWMTGGHATKRHLGSWIRGAMRLLAGLRFLRGTAFDPFGWQADRRLERRLIVEYEQWVTQLLEKLDTDNHPRAVELVLKTGEIRGFGHIKASNYRRVHAELTTALLSFDRRKENREVA